MLPWHLDEKIKSLFQLTKTFFMVLGNYNNPDKNF